MMFLPSLLLFFFFCPKISPAPSLLQIQNNRCHHEVPKGSTLYLLEDGRAAVEYPSGEHFILPDCPKNISTPSLSSSNPPTLKSDVDPNNQWCAWYSAACSVFGCKSFLSQWTTPSNPQDPHANIAFFNGLQPTYDPEPYDFIMQPVSLWGNIWFANVGRQWGCVATTCVGNQCISSPVFVSGTEHKIFGNITYISNDMWEITITDLTNGNSTNVRYKTTYMATFAFLTLEHAPGGAFTNCDQIDIPPYEVTFSDVQVKPDVLGEWTGTQNNFDCGIHVKPIATGPDFKIDL